MSVKRADELVVGDALADGRVVGAVQALSRGDIGVRFEGEAQGTRYAAGFRFMLEDITIDWQRLALRRLWNHPNATVQTACRNVITATRTEAGL